MKQPKYIFVTGGVVSSLGKGITAASIGRILKNRGLKVFMQKFDPYLNVNPSNMSPFQHGEVFVTDDGAETDLDLGHYERFIDENLNKEASITTGKIYLSVIKKERNNEYDGATVQVIPHITNEIKNKLISAYESSDADIIITEIGGTVGDIESLPFLEAIRQARRDFGFENTLFIHNVLVPYLKAAGEIKTKPTQHSVKELKSLGIQPDMIVLRTEVDIEKTQKDKIALFCDVKEDHIFEAKDVDIIYEIILKLQQQGIDDAILKHFNLEAKPCELSEFSSLIETIKGLKEEVNICIVGKYVSLQDAYISVIESLRHAGFKHHVRVHVDLVSSEDITDANVSERLSKYQGIVIPGGFGKRGTEGKIAVLKYARLKKIPLLGICYGMQLSVIEYARTAHNLVDADSVENNPASKYPLFNFIEGYNRDFRLGLRDIEVLRGTHAFEIYQNTLIKERHRHKYEFDRKYLDAVFDDNLVVSGYNKETNAPSIVELKDHPFFIGVQFHPEFLSRPNRPHTLFASFLAAILAKH